MWGPLDAQRSCLCHCFAVVVLRFVLGHHRGVLAVSVVPSGVTRCCGGRKPCRVGGSVNLELCTLEAVLLALTSALLRAGLADYEEVCTLQLKDLSAREATARAELADCVLVEEMYS